MIQIVLSFVFIVLIAAIVLYVINFYKTENVKDGKVLLKTIVLCLVITLLLGLFNTILRYKYTKDKVITIIPISEIYNVNNEQYLIKNDKGNTFTVSFMNITDVVKGDDSYVIHTRYPNTSGLSKFLINGPENKCTIVLNDFNIPKLDNLSD